MGAKSVIFGQRGFIREKVVLFGQKYFYLGKRLCILANVFVLVQGGCNCAKWLCSCKVVVFGQDGCVRAKVVVFGIKLFYWGKSSCIWAKVVVFGQKWM